MRYVAPLGTVAVVTAVVSLTPNEPVYGIIWFAVLVICAWVGGVGPSLLMAPLLLLLSRLFPREQP